MFKNGGQCKKKKRARHGQAKWYLDNACEGVKDAGVRANSSSDWLILFALNNLENNMALHGIRTCLPILTTLFSLALFAADEWPGVKYAEVRAYAWPVSGRHPDVEEVILKDLNLKDGAINKEGAVLSAEQVKRLLAAVTGKHEQHAAAACYEPHNAFVFYDAEMKPVAFVEVCFHCMGKRILPKGAASPIDYVALAAIFGELKLPLGEYPDAASFEKDFKRRNEPKQPGEPAKDSAPKSTPAK